MADRRFASVIDSTRLLRLSGGVTQVGSRLTIKQLCRIAQISVLSWHEVDILVMPLEILSTVEAAIQEASGETAVPAIR